MAWTTSTCPRGRHARAQAMLVWLDKHFEVCPKRLRDVSGRAIPIAALLHLATIAVAVLAPTREPLPILVTITGLLLAVLSLSRLEGTASSSPVSAPTQSGLECDSKALDLERQAQRLVEIADRASRARHEAELREHLWAELSARMSHELRTPLNAVIGFSDMMSAEVFGPLGDRRYHDYLHHIRQGGRDLLKSAEDTLALTSALARPTPKHATVELATVIAEAWSFFGSRPAECGITLRSTCPTGLEITGEQRAMRQILINILAEALKHAPQNGKIEISTADDGATVLLRVGVSNARRIVRTAEAPLEICIARVLLEQQGSGLIEGSETDETWSAVTCLDRATQPDFFSATCV